MDDTPDDIDEEEDEGDDDEYGGQWLVATYNTNPDTADKMCTFPWGKSRIGNEFWIWKKHHHPGAERAHNTETKTILVTIVKDAATTQQTIKLDWKEQPLRTGSGQKADRNRPAL